jgi:hypothetical protein
VAILIGLSDMGANSHMMQCQKVTKKGQKRLTKKGKND